MENVTQLAPGTLWARGVRGRSTDDGAVAGAGGGTGIDANLTPPVLALAVAGNVYPPQLDATLDVTWITGDKIRLQSCASIAFGTLIIDDLHTITNAEVLAGSISYGALLSGITSPTVTWFRARGEHAAGNSNWSNIVVHGDVTAPTITSSAAISVNENTVLAHTLTANESIYSWTVTGGVDSAQFEIAGTTLRWLGNGTKDYEVPTDSGANNVYNVQVTATDYAGNAANQSIAVTVNDLNENPTGLSGFFTDVTGATQSTLYTSSNTYTVAGLATTVPITITGGSYSKNGAGFTAGAETVQNGDTVQLQTTSSGSTGSTVSVVVSIGGGSDTWTVRTAGTPALPTSGLILQMESDDLSTLFQNIAGSTAVTADGQTVGMWKNKQADGFNPAAAADDTTRPTYNTTSSLSWVTFDGSNDILFTTSARGLYSGGACTVIAAVRPNAMLGQTAVSEGRSTGATASLYSIIQANSTTPAVAQVTMKDDSNNFPLGGAALHATAFASTTDVVIGFTDTGSAVQGYKDGTTDRGTTPYIRATTTLDRFSVGGVQRSAATNLFNGRIYGVWAWNRVLSSSEIADAVSYAGAKQGRTI